MLIGVKRRFVFVANSKTGSTSIERLLTPYAEINRVGSPQRKHICWKDIRNEYDFLFKQKEYAPETFLKFGVIRDPVDWVRSWYNYRLANPKVEHPLPEELTFECFWRECQDWVKNIRQSQVFSNTAGECCMDVLIPLENLSPAMSDVLQILGLPPASLPMENKSPGKFAREDISLELVREISMHYAEDVALYQHWRDVWQNALRNSNNLHKLGHVHNN